MSNSKLPTAATAVAHLRPKQAAARHGVSLSWLWSAIADGRISRPQKIGARISLFQIDQLDHEFAALMADRKSPKQAA
jgi:predicted DNA-binding transcriptional regulator AlpA